MPASYPQIKEEALYILDEFRDQRLIPISIGYGSHYSAARNSYTFVPQLGYLQDYRTDMGSDHGHWASAYAVLHADAQLNAWLPQLSTTVDYERFTDRSVPAGNVRRDVGHTTMSIRRLGGPQTDERSAAIDLPDSRSRAGRVGCGKPRQ